MISPRTRRGCGLVLESMLGYTSQVLLSGQAIPGGLKAEFPEHEETLRPDLMLAEPGTHKPRLLIQVYPPASRWIKHSRAAAGRPQSPRG